METKHIQIIVTDITKLQSAKEPLKIIKYIHIFYINKFEKLLNNYILACFNLPSRFKKWSINHQPRICQVNYGLEVLRSLRKTRPIAEQQLRERSNQFWRKLRPIQHTEKRDGSTATVVAISVSWIQQKYRIKQRSERTHKKTLNTSQLPSGNKSRETSTASADSPSHFSVLPFSIGQWKAKGCLPWPATYS
jgi:hypothetical protein